MNGADEIDMVINVGWVKDGRVDCIEQEIRTLKTAGSLSSMADAEKFLELGADRLGTSRIVKLVKQGSGQ